MNVRRISTFGWAVTLLAVSAGGLQAGENVTFDVSQMVACGEISSEAARLFPGQQIIEARIRVSTFATGYRSSQLSQMEVQAVNLRPQAWIVDYSPKTTLATDIVGAVNVERGNEAANHLGLDVSASYDRWLKVGGLADTTSKRREVLKFEQLPELNNIASSGLIARGTGAYFKLRDSTQTSLEGGKDFVLQLRVPANWQAGLIEVTCRAWCRERGMFSSSEEKTCGSGRFLVAIYRAGDAKAEQLAQAFTDAEAEVYRLARRHADEIRRLSLPTLAHRLAAAFEVVQPAIPADWVQQVLESEPAGKQRTILRRLPQPIQDAVKRYHEAKRNLLR